MNYLGRIDFGSVQGPLFLSSCFTFVGQRVVTRYECPRFECTLEIADARRLASSAMGVKYSSPRQQTCSHQSRQELLQGLAVLGAGTLLPSGQLPAQGGDAGRIDVHQHYVSPDYLALPTRKSATSPVAGFNVWKDYSPPRNARAVATSDSG